MVWYHQGRLLGALFVAVGLGLTAAGCGSSSPRPVPPGSGAGGTDVELPDEQPVAESVAGYKLGAGDQIRLTVFRHEDLSGEFELDGEGQLALPLIDDIDAHGLTARQLEQAVETELKDEGYLVNPQVSIEVLNYRPFYIIGEVNNPGSYPYVNGMTVINAVALAGGYTYRADQGDITLTRGGAKGEAREVGPEEQVLPGDIIEVPERFF